MLNNVKNALVRYYKDNQKEINKALLALSYSIDPWNTYRLYCTEG